MPVAPINITIPWGFVRPVPHPRPFGAISRVGTVSIGPMYQPLGQACPACSIATGTQCLPCPDGSDLAECAGCVGGQPPAATFWQRWGIPIALAAATAVAGTLAVMYVQGRRRR